MNEKFFILQERAKMFCLCRDFFAKRNILEVDCPALLSFPSMDRGIELFATKGKGRYLHSSPEYAMKRLLAEGLSDIFQISHVFRKEEVGKRHNPEFTMVEWYRSNQAFSSFVKEVFDLIFLFLPQKPFKEMSYAELFLEYAGVDIFSVSKKELLALLQEKQIDLAKSARWGKEILLQIVLTHLIEPKFPKEQFLLLKDFPLSQAALAKTYISQGHILAERFEIYYEDVELANGYHELNDPEELKKRFSLLKNKTKVDERFFEALPHMGDVFGVAVGFDRLLQLKLQKESIQEVLPFGWEEI